VGLFLPSIIALVLMYLTVWFGAACPGLTWEGGLVGEWIRYVNTWLASWPIWAWVAVLLAYCYWASVLPVWMLLQPRDYINSLQLISTLGLIVFGIAWVGWMGGPDGQPVEMVAPMVNWHPLGAPPIWPFLFITIACGAISGFHCLVSSGTSSKQLSRETDAQFVGYGAMLTEGFLAVLVILAVAAGIGLGWPGHATWSGLTGSELWNEIYGDWRAADAGLGVKIGAFVVGAANFLVAYGINHTMAVAIMGVMVASFAGTTLDTAMRLQRYVIQELSRAAESALPPLAPLTAVIKTSYGATLLAAVSAFLMALPPMPGQAWSWDTIGTGGLILWPLFGATNQLLAGLAFLVTAFYLWRRNRPVWFLVPPLILMIVMPAWALVWQMFNANTGWLPTEDYLLLAVGAVTLLLQVWMVVEALLIWPRAKGVLEEGLPPLPTPLSAT
jgi:carbon starvation protein